MSKQTAVEWLVEKLSNIKAEDVNSTLEVRLICQQAKSMEKEQIMDAYWNGTTHISKEEALSDAEKFYNEYYKKTYENNK